MGSGSQEKRMWNVNTEEELENEAWKPNRVRFVLFAERLLLRKSEKRAFEGSLRAESEFRSQLELASVFWSVKWINQACPTAFADYEDQLRYYIKKMRGEVTTEKVKEVGAIRKKDRKEGTCNQPCCHLNREYSQ
ncbi:hypothetical protein HJG60_010573 [Phyllostomus discolor]|uniref:Uncharacterized protein n=1 Tax=Phyllostomus discolor TaxID=89673 RepID=A0A834ANE4_9CHIR|nr:hypothetical protein HJG60_010573 [Phyllostomus discolor]